MIRKLVTFCMISVLLVGSRSPKYLLKIRQETETKFGFEVAAPNSAVFFIENESSSSELSAIDRHKKIANTLYNKYEPARNNFHIGSTNAKDFKFNLNPKTYYINVQTLPQPTAMILFDGKRKPRIYFKPEKYDKKIKRMNLQKQKEHDQS